MELWPKHTAILYNRYTYIKSPFCSSEIWCSKPLSKIPSHLDLKQLPNLQVMLVIEIFFKKYRAYWNIYLFRPYRLHLHSLKWVEIKISNSFISFKKCSLFMLTLLRDARNEAWQHKREKEKNLKIISMTEAKNPINFVLPTKI